MHFKHLTKDSIIFSDKTEKQHIIREMVSKLEEAGRIKNSMRYYAQVIHRESLENTGIGNSFAIPHARTESVDELSMLFCVAKNGIDYDSYDGKPVRFLLLSIFPSSYSTTYLYYISMMATIFSDDSIISRLENAQDANEIYTILEEQSGFYFDKISEQEREEVDHSANLAGVPSAELDLLIRLDRLYKMNGSMQCEIIMEKITNLEHLIDNRSLTYYKRMQQKCATPFAFVEKQACSGCHMNIPPIELNAIKERKNISLCSNCGRFLLYV
ncbi:MAG: PTS sugar transporter subunit IIA [Spirochaetes bacterium]|nr:PTS sugar transporter subunit IIA [Spirochaetota bacterium]MBN2770595.1 PTS sugar transporter subunit IIA [Spirochaetota bacterium]